MHAMDSAPFTLHATFTSIYMHIYVCVYVLSKHNMNSIHVVFAADQSCITGVRQLRCPQPKKHALVLVKAD